MEEASALWYEKLLNDRKKEAETWNFEKINQEYIDRNKSLSSLLSFFNSKLFNNKNKETLWAAIYTVLQKKRTKMDNTSLLKIYVLLIGVRIVCLVF